jgi:hypothetical protein
MDYEVKRGTDTVATVALIGHQNKKVMADNLVNATLSLTETIDLQINDYIDVFVEDKIERYFLLDTEDIKKSSTIEFDYSITFKGWQYKLANAAFLFPDADNEYTLPGQPMMGNLHAFLDLIIINANRDQSGWIKGAVDESDYRLITFNEKENCLSALSTLAVEYNVEWWVDGQTIHMTKKGVTENISFEYGMGKGLYDITRNSSNARQVFTRLYAYGSDKNIPANYKGFSNKLKLPGTKPYLEKNVYNNDNPADGIKYGVIENTEIFPDIYPHRTGTVTAVGADIYTFSDSGIDFDVNAQLLGEGIKAQLTFNTGQLGGYAFEINAFDFGAKQFKINKNESDKAFVLPTELIKPAVGDQYVITGIEMPASYITAAENALQVAAQAFLEENATPVVTYSVTCDPLNFKNRKIVLTLGNYVHLKDADFGLDKYIRIIGYTRDLQNPYLYTIELAEVVAIAAIVKSYQKYDAITNAVNINKLTDVNRSRMNWKTTQQLRDMIYDPDGYFDGTKIRPNSIETLMLSVGAKAQQFVLEGCLIQANYQGDAAKFGYTGGRLTHFTLFDTPHVFEIGGGYQAGLDPAKFFYIYARCPKDNSSGSIYLSEDPITTEQFDGAYFFWIGGLSSVIDGVRGISLTYGSTTVNGRFITTGVIQSADGQTSFDLDKGVIKGKIQFEAGSKGYGNLSDRPNLSILENDIANAQASASASAQALAYMANDNVLTPQEKPAVLKDWQMIASEKPIIDDQADAYGVDRTQYDGFYSQLSGYISTYVLNDMNADSYVSGDTFRLYFQHYYDAKVSLLKAVSDKAKVLVDNATTTANAAEAITSYLFTTIDGNVVATGTLLVGDETHNNGGITGVTDRGDKSVGFWQGAAYADRYNSPYQLLRDGSFISTKGKIGNWDITSGGIINDDGTAYIIARNYDSEHPEDGTAEARIGTNVFPASSGVVGVAYFENSKVNPYGVNYGAVFKVTGGMQNIALQVEGTVKLKGGADWDLNGQELILRNVSDVAIPTVKLQGVLRVHQADKRYLVLG